MNISELIEILEKMRAEHGDILVYTDDYNGGDYDLTFPTPKIREGHPQCLGGPALILNG